MATHKLTGKVAIITGSSSGIGAAIAVEFSRLGAQVTIHGRNTSKLSQVAKQCEEVSPGNEKASNPVDLQGDADVLVCTVTGDLLNEDVRNKLIAQTIQCFGKLDILVNNAGSGNCAKLEDVSLENLDLMLGIHVRAPYHLTKLALPELIKNKGSVVNNSSVLSQRPISPTFCMEYGMAKAASDQFTLWMARELGEKGVRVNSINPGVVMTDILSNLALPEEQIKQTFTEYAQRNALGRVAQSEEIAKVVAFLVSKDASFVTGLTMRVDGGAGTMPAGPRIEAA